MTVDVVIVTADTREMTLGCIADLNEPEVGRIVVVDNASSDGTAEAIRERFPSVVVVRLESGVGFASACNRGAEHCDAPLVLFLNSDILTTEGAIGTLARTLDERPAAVAAGGRLVDPGTDHTQKAYRPRTFPSAATLAVQLLGIEEKWPENPVTRRHFGEDLDDATTVAVQQPAAAAVLVRRDVFERIGGFDERFWFWFEDSDLLKRLFAEGEVLYVPSAAFQHLGGGTFRQWSKTEVVRSLHHGMLHYADAQLGAWQRRVIGLLTLLVSAPRLALFRRSRPGEWAAWRDVARAGAALVRGQRVPVLAGPDNVDAAQSAGDPR